MFRLSNNLIQSIFDDGSEIMFNASNKEVIYISKIGEKTNLSLGEVMVSNNTELVQRFGYVKQVL